MTRPSGKIYTLSLFPAIDTTLYLEGMEPVRELPAQREHSEAGGKGANTAAALTALGLDCACICVEFAGSFIVLHTRVLSALRHSYSGLSCFLMIRSRTFFDGSKGFILLSKEHKKSEPFSYRKKVRILLLW